MLLALSPFVSSSFPGFFTTFILTLILRQVPVMPATPPPNMHAHYSLLLCLGIPRGICPFACLEWCLFPRMKTCLFAYLETCLIADLFISIVCSQNLFGNLFGSLVGNMPLFYTFMYVRSVNETTINPFFLLQLGNWRDAMLCFDFLFPGRGAAYFSFLLLLFISFIKCTYTEMHMHCIRWIFFLSFSSFHSLLLLFRFVFLFLFPFLFFSILAYAVKCIHSHMYIESTKKKTIYTSLSWSLSEMKDTDLRCAPVYVYLGACVCKWIKYI